MRESDFQTKVIRWLKSKGCYVVKINQDVKSRAGDPDVMAFKEGWWGWFEIKRAKNAPKRPLQEAKIKWAAGNSYGKIVYPENWDETKGELEVILS